MHEHANRRTAATAYAEAEELVAFFAEGWRIGASDPERFFAHFGGRLTARRADDPAAGGPEARGPQGLRDLFTPLFEAVPDLRVDVLRWGADRRTAR